MFSRLPQVPFFIILSIWSLISQCTTPSSPQDEPLKPRQGFLWEAKRGAEILTLVGTMHIGITKADMPQTLWTRFAAADTIIVETDVDKVDPDSLRRFLYLPSSEDLKAKLGPKHWPLLLKRLAEANALPTEESLRRLSPLAIGSQLLRAEAKDDPADQGETIDQAILNQARAEGKKTRTFETPLQQLGFLREVFTIPTLREMLDTPESETIDYQTLKEAFKQGDALVLERLLEEFPLNLRSLLLDERNRNWVRTLSKSQGGQNTLIAVGAAHFAGPSSLLNLLSKEGYTLRRL